MSAQLCLAAILLAPAVLAIAMRRSPYWWALSAAIAAIGCLGVLATALAEHRPGLDDLGRVAVQVISAAAIGYAALLWLLVFAIRALTPPPPRVPPARTL